MATFSLQAQPTDAADWLDLARRAETAGFHTLYVADHPGSCAAPFVALAAAAAVTSTIRLGSYVVNAGVREPILVAADVATLDVVSGGRAVLGIGAGHTPAEWAAVGRVRPGVAARVDHCIAVAEATVRMLAGDGLAKPRPVQEKVPLLFGGGNTRLLRWAAGHADLIGLSGLGRTLEDGHMHAARFRPDQVDAQVELAGGTPVEALVHYVEVTDDAGATYQKWAESAEISEAEMAATPYALAGTESEIRAKLDQSERRWGLTRYAIRRPAFEACPALLAM
ncbi:LLM class flavin-dependent oxidoreductase [Actinoplanes palleronii]|uniref:LLM class F420-dependent oxidoreductase n=1 Tax=Actinoplanes palleronii TaxID=113570 RepID=A0ABQ4B6H6_9ACTN|nr:LLM class flavin-dependent oxidoreductase [Actinoplanes palleronii]GIE66231.1 LLM class F420-dependent oxidoreductase [Actinoplanes palleronii]